MGSPDAWLRAEKLTGEVVAILAKRSEDVDAGAKQALHERAEGEAKKAIVSGEATLVARALRLCRLEETLRIPHRTACSGLLAIEKRK